MSDSTGLAEFVAVAGPSAEIDAIFARDAEFFRAISRYGIRPVVFVGFAMPADTRDEARKQTDAALLAAIGRTQQR